MRRLPALIFHTIPCAARPVFLIVLFLTCLTPALSQNIYLTGFIRDSTTYQPLAYVNISHNTGKIIGASDLRGYFSLTVQNGDTLVLTRLGYRPVLLLPSENEWDLTIRMVETSKMLDNVTIYDRFEIHGQGQIQKAIREGSLSESNSFQNPTQKPGSDYAVQTFGPGYTFKAPFSKYSKEELEKKRLREIYFEQQRTGVYREVIHSEQVRQYLTHLFSLDDAAYHKKLEAFALKFPGAENLRTRKEVIDMLVVFFAAKEKE